MKIMRLVSSVAAVAIAAGATSIVLTMPDAQTEPDSAPLYTAEGGTVSLVCTGGIERTLQQGINIDAVDEELSGTAGVISLGGDATWTPTTGSAEPRDVSGVLEPQTTTALGVPEVTGTMTLSGEDVSTGVVAGSSNHIAKAGDLRGLAINPCTWADSTVWLVGGSGEVGSSNRLLVTNPGLTPVTVKIEAFSSIGPMDIGSSENLVIAPQSSEEHLLDGVIDPDARIALRLTADSGTFGATMQTTALDGFSPSGVSAISPAQSGTELTIPGVLIDAAPSSAEGDILADPNQEANLRIVNPGEETATVSISTTSDDGTEALPGGSAVDVIPGGVLDLTLEGLAPGAHDITVTSESDISAAVRMARTSEDGTDVAWAGARSSLVRGAAAYDGEARLSLSGESEVTWVAYDADGQVVEESTESLDGTTTLVDLPQSRYVSIESDSPVNAAVIALAEVSGGRGIEWVPVVTHGAGAQSLRVAIAN